MTATSTRTAKMQYVKQQLCTCITLFLHLFAVTGRLRPENAYNFTFCGGREHITTTFFFFSCTSIQPVRIQLLKKCEHLTNNLLKEMKYARLSLKQRDYTFKWHNGHVRECHSCYVKIHAPNVLYWWLMPFTQGSKEGGDHPTSPLVAEQSNAWGTDPLTPETGIRAAAG